MKKNVKLIVTVSSIALLLCACRGGRGRGSSVVPPTSDDPTTSVVPVTTGIVPTSGTTQGGSSGTTGTSQASSTTGTTQSGSSSTASSSHGTSSTQSSSSSHTTSSTQPTSITPTSSTASTSQSSDVQAYYASISDSLTGTDLLNALNSLNNSKRKRKVGYDGMKTFAAKCDADPNGSGKIIGFYDNAKIGPSWDSAKTWNREHVWPNCRGGSLVEADAHMPRPASVSTNSDRGSKGFGTGSYDPGKSVAYYRGVSARIIFYCAIADKSLKLIEDPINYDGGQPDDSMGCLSDMLKWNLQYLPSNTSFTGGDDLARRVELQRNEVIEKDSSGQGNRNPFIDHPEYACRIWGNTNSTTRSICGM